MAEGNRDHPGGATETRSRPAYFIGVVAEMTEVHPQTLRHYERIGLLLPSRSPGNVRLFSQNDVDRIQLIQRLTHELGINLAGVEVILNMRDRHEAQKAEYEARLAALEERTAREIQRLRNTLRRAIG
jgi:MerR family transcriptional regulator/heat shock protein HspR